MKKFELIKKSYKEEVYQMVYSWNNIPIKISVNMVFHTFLKHWTTYVYVSGYVFGVEIKDTIKNSDTRKEARGIAIKLMNKIEKDPEAVIDSVDEFHKKSFFKRSLFGGD